MATTVSNSIAGLVTEEVRSIRNNWGWFVALGIVQIAVGMLALSFAFSATLASMVALGVLLLVAAGAQLGAAIWARDWSGFFLFLLVGVLYAVAGFFTLQQPVLAAESLTLMLAATYVVGGVFRVIFALVERFPSWGWVLANGVLAILLGIAIWLQWPASGLWVIGMFVSIDLIVNGTTWLMLAVSVRGGLARSTSR